MKHCKIIAHVLVVLEGVVSFSGMALDIPRDEPLCRSRGGSPSRDEQNRRSPMLVSREQVASNYGDFFQESTVMAE